MSLLIVAYLSSCLYNRTNMIFELYLLCVIKALAYITVS